MLVSIQPYATVTSDHALKHRITHLPILVLDLHSRCQCKCVMCDIWQRASSHELPFEMLLRNRGTLVAMGVRWVVLSGGEPLMHSRFADICAFLREEGIRITLLTAGLSLAKHHREVAYGVDDVIISLDGPKTVHDQVRGVAGAYDLLATGILGLLSLRPEMQVRARTTVQKANHEHLCETVLAAHELDLSGISFLAADLASAAFNREAPWSSSKQNSIALDHSEVQALETEVERLVKKYQREIASGYIAENPTKLRRLVQHFRAHLGDAPHRAPLCNAPWVSAVVGHDGSVRPCFFHEPVGSLSTQTLEQAVNNDASMRFRSTLDIDQNPTCQRCVCSLYRPERGDE